MRCTSENVPKVSARKIGIPVAVLTCTEMRTRWSTTATPRTVPGRCLMSARAMARSQELGTRNLVDGDLPQQIEFTEHLAGAQDHRRQRILGARHRQPGLLAQPLVEVLQQ